jgi:glutamyl endopeptidase
VFREFDAALACDTRVSDHPASVAPERRPQRIVERGSTGTAGGPVALGDPIAGDPSARAGQARAVDVARLSFGPPAAVARAIVGDDDRRRVVDTSAYPWRAIASLEMRLPDDQAAVGTGWFVGPSTVVTAGHCVFVHDEEGRYRDWVRAVRVLPGRDGAAQPFGAGIGTRLHSVIGWVRDKDPRYDYGVITIKPDLGAEVGWASLAVLDDQELVGSVATISGYPSDKAGAEDGTQWFDRRTIRSVDEHRLHYDVDTWTGQSGSVVHVERDGVQLAVGIHAYGDSLFSNSGTRITPSVYANLTAWRE